MATTSTPSVLRDQNVAQFEILGSGARASLLRGQCEALAAHVDQLEDVEWESVSEITHAADTKINEAIDLVHEARRRAEARSA